MIFCGSGVKVFLSIWLLGVRGVWGFVKGMYIFFGVVVSFRF